jgi:hypothetical protein
VTQTAARLLTTGVHPLGVGVAVRGGVGVDHPDDPALEDHRVGVGVVVEERGHLVEALTDVAQVQDARLVGDEVRDQGIDVAEAEGERRPPQPRLPMETPASPV